MERPTTLALLNVRLDGSYQTQIWRGAAMAARLLGVRLVALVGCSYGDVEQRGGTAEIFDLASSELVDGYLPVVGALSNFMGTAPVLDLLERLPRRPVVCIGMGLPGHASIAPAGGGMEDLVHHLVVGHGVRRIAYIGGTSSNSDAAERYAGFLKVIVEHGIELPPGYVVEADFTAASAQEQMRRILTLGDPPQAVVCANDTMALGVREVLVKHGLRIPEDVLLTGYDDIDECRTMVPPLTSVDASSYHIAFRAVEMLVEMLHGAPVRQETIPVSLVVRRSCGCRASASSMSLPRLQVEASNVPKPAMLREILSDKERSEEFLRRMDGTFDRADHAEIDHWEQVLLACAGPEATPDAIRTVMQAHAIVSQARHGLDLRHRQELQQIMREEYLAMQMLFDDLSVETLPSRLLEKFRHFSDARLRILLFNEDLSPETSPDYGNRPFRLEIDTWTGTVRRPGPIPLLPEENGNSRWGTLSIFLGTEHYGVIQFREWVSNEIVLESFRMSLCMILSSAQKERRETLAREELRRISSRDELTGILNRRGLMEQGETLLRAARRSGSRIGVVLFDLDGLKGINDRWGHADGDLAIRSLARAMEDGFRQSDVVGRLGGDEFAAITVLGDEGALDGAIDRVRRALVRRSNELSKPWRARTSAGWMAWDPSDGCTLEQAMARADGLLYHDKRERKARLMDETSSTIEVWTPPPPSPR
jgi:diguanylate cyclase (GGDEF)-like protein